ncbi:MAG: RDD family protein [Pyrinomonadaceae bacterium]
MVNDSVREELASSITPLAAGGTLNFAAAVVRTDGPIQTPSIMSEPKPPKRSQTADLSSKKTSPTLAQFVNPNAVVPDWRIELQNKVRQRTGGTVAVERLAANAGPPSAGASRGGAALKVQYEADRETETDTKLANALKRIEDSRRAYLPTEKAREGIRVAKAAAASRNYPFNVVSRSNGTAAKPSNPSTATSTSVSRPKLVSALKIEKKGYDTNKLVPIPEAEYMAAAGADSADSPSRELKKDWSHRIEISESGISDEIRDAEIKPETDEIDDLAPISARFNAGLFDLIVGGVASLILFSPIVGLYDSWASVSGLLVFAGILMTVMFLYLTASVALLGQSLGMKIFSLELVDIEQSQFPTLHQAAVNSSVYILSLAFGGLGFLPVLFNEERRAAHDLASGTILVREI